MKNKNNIIFRLKFRQDLLCLVSSLRNAHIGCLLPKLYPLSALFLSILLTTALSAQNISITGTVYDAKDSVPLPGVTVINPLTAQGVVSNLEGFYSIDVPSNTDSLYFRFIGMETQQIAINNRATINIYLSKELYQMNEVVVTALGISREKKTVGYAVTSVNSEDLESAAGRSPLNALSGKVAGVNISSASGAPGASTRVLVRGVTSLSGGNQPLFVIDGVPVSNASSGSASINGGTDFGNSMNDINPEDIESINFLKGSSGTALYGSRAANGVVEITTKKGKKSTKTQVSFSSSFGFESPLRLIDYQNSYGQGIYGNSVLYENMSWGPAFDDKYHPWGHEVDGVIRVKPYSALKDNVEEFFTTGKSYTNNFSVTGGTERTTYFFSYSNTLWDGIFPGNSDAYKKHTLSLRGSHNIHQKISISTSVNYINKKNSSVPTGQGEQSVYNQIMQTPRDISLLEISDLDTVWNTVDNHYSLYTLNPYFVLQHNGNENREDKILGSAALNFKPIQSVAILFRFGGDVSNGRRKLWQERVVPEGNNEFSAVFVPGSVTESSFFNAQYSADVIATYEKRIQKFEFTLRAGASANQQESRSVSTTVSNLSLPGFFHLSNSTEKPTSAEGSAVKRMNGVFGNIDFSYNKWINFSITNRNEWSSSLPRGNNSYYFPGVSGSIVFTDILPGIRELLTFGKLRASWARVGNDAPVFSTASFYNQGGHSDGFGFFTYPVQGVNGYEVGNMISNPNLRPEQTEEFELGTDLRFINNRFGIDFAVYEKTTTDLIWAAPVASTSGYTFQTQNLGKLSNKGFEVLVNYTIVKKSNLKWDFSVNFTRNINKLISLNNQTEKAVLNSLRVAGGQQINWLAVPGQPVGVYEARGPLYNNNGQMVVDNQGLPRADDDLVVYGNSQYKYFGGVSTKIQYKGFALSTLMDYRVGGVMYSRTKDISLWAGTGTPTLFNNREPFIIPNSVIETGKDGSGEPVYIENSVPIDDQTLLQYWANGGSEIDGSSLIDKTFIKLRQLELSYTIPNEWANWLKLSGISLSVIGNNLLLFTPEDQNFIDPELTTFGNDFGADFGEYGAQPSVRSVVFNLRVNF